MEYTTTDFVVTTIFSVLTVLGILAQVIAPSLKWEDCVTKAKANFALQTFGSRIGWDFQLVTATLLFGVVWWIGAPLFMLYCVISYVVYAIMIVIGFVVKADKELIAEYDGPRGFFKSLIVIAKESRKINY